MKVTHIRSILFIISIVVLIGFDTTNLQQHAFLFKVINAMAAYYVLYEFTLQLIRIFYRGVYDYLMHFLDGNIKLNKPLHDRDPLSLYEKSKTVMVIIFIHLFTLVASLIAFIKF
jgi:sulfopyruvate decarboxylase TPP-binding subunit